MWFYPRNMGLWVEMVVWRAQEQRGADLVVHRFQKGTGGLLDPTKGDSLIVGSHLSAGDPEGATLLHVTDSYCGCEQ